MPHRNVTIAYERIAELESENAKLRDAFMECVSVKDEFNRLIQIWKARAENAEALLASGILLKRHSADERPEGWYLLKYGRNQLIIERWWEGKPDWICGTAGAIYGPIELPEVTE